MIYIRFDMQDSRVVWGNPNLRWGEPSYLLEPGDAGYVQLQPGQPGYQAPPKPPKKKKPFRRKAKSETAPNPTPSPTNTMPTFKYNGVPKSNGGFTTRVLLGDEWDDATVDAAVAAATSLTAAQCSAVLKAYLAQWQLCAAGCAWKHDSHGILSIRPTSGGSAATPDDFHNAQDINANLSIVITPEVKDDFQASLTIESQGQIGLLVPEIDSIIDLFDGAEDAYTPGELFQISGSNLGIDKTDALQGVFYATAAALGTKVRITGYGPISPTEINAIMPAGLTGALTISVTVKISGTYRTATHLNPIS